MAGQTSSLDFPLKNPVQAANHGLGDAFVTKLNPSGDGLVYSTFLGGGVEDMAMGLAIDSAGDAYVAGITYSADFPTMSAFQAAIGGGADAFVAKVPPNGAPLLYSTYLGRLQVLTVDGTEANTVTVSIKYVEVIDFVCPALSWDPGGCLVRSVRGSKFRSHRSVPAASVYVRINP